MFGEITCSYDSRRIANACICTTMLAAWAGAGTFPVFTHSHKAGQPKDLVSFQDVLLCPLLGLPMGNDGL